MPVIQQYGDIILVHGDNIISEAIQHLTQSFFSHAALCADPGKVAEMTRFGFKYQDNHYLDGSRPYVVLRHRWLFPYNPARLRYLYRIKGVVETFRRNPPKYDYFEILNQALKLILSREGQLAGKGDHHVLISLLIQASERLICSALIDSVYESAGIDLFPGRISRHTTPADLAFLAAGPRPALVEVFRSPEIEKAAQPGRQNPEFRIQNPE